MNLITGVKELFVKMIEIRVDLVSDGIEAVNSLIPVEGIQHLLTAVSEYHANHSEATASFIESLFEELTGNHLDVDSVVDLVAQLGAFLGSFFS